MPGPRRSTREAREDNAWPRLRFEANPKRLSSALILCTGDSWIARVRAETLSDIVPEDIMVDMNFREEEEEVVVLYAALSSSKTDIA